MFSRLKITVLRAGSIGLQKQKQTLNSMYPVHCELVSSTALWKDILLLPPQYPNIPMLLLQLHATTYNIFTIVVSSSVVNELMTMTTPVYVHGTQHIIPRPPL